MISSFSPDQLVEKAQAAYQAGEFSQAASLFDTAAREYELDNNPLKAAEMQNNRSVSLLKAGDNSGALAAALGTDQIFSQAGDKRRQAIALGNQAAALESQGKKDQALALYRQCSDLLKEVDDPQTRTFVLKSISALQMRTGKQFEALASMEAALDIKEHLTMKEWLLKKLLRVPFKMLR
jgi:tetratricopeptide (TPR) repeat protein